MTDYPPHTLNILIQSARKAKHTQLEVMLNVMGLSFENKTYAFKITLLVNSSAIKLFEPYLNYKPFYEAKFFSRCSRKLHVAFVCVGQILLGAED
jgi:hypothetical protein